MNGVDIDIAKLYPPVAFPVSRGTPMISSTIKWDHRQNYFVPLFDSCNFYERRNLSINISDKSYDFVKGHVIDGELIYIYKNLMKVTIDPQAKFFSLELAI